jgi:potassium efflux system protein
MRLLAIAAVVAIAPISFAQTNDERAAVAELEAGIEAVKNASARADTTEARAPLLDRANRLLDSAVVLQKSLGLPVDRVQQRMAQLGPDATKSTDPAVLAQHGELSEELARYQALVSRSALVEVEAQQLIGALGEQQARALGEALFARSASPLSPALWTAGLAAFRADLTRAGSAQTGSAPQRWPWGFVVFGFIAWIGLVWLLAAPGERAMDRLGKALADRVAGREAMLSLALFATWSIAVAVAIAVIAGLSLIILMQAAGLKQPWADLLAGLVTAIVIGFFARAVVLAIVRPGCRMWRLWKIGDPAADHVAKAANALGAAIALVIAVEAAIVRLGLDATTQVFLHSALALVSTAQLAYALFMLGRLRGDAGTGDAAEDQARRGRVALWVGIGWMLLGGLAVAGVLGYVSFANRFSQWAIWGAVVATTTYVLMVLIDGLCRLLASTRTRGRQAAPAGRALQQAAVLLSAVSRLLLLMLALGALLVPFGAGFTSVLGVLEILAKGVEVGGVSISLAAFLRAALAFAIVIALSRFLRGWISTSYLPTTALQEDARASIDKILRYAGIVLASLWALTAFGIGMEKVAILASALSVGIGFGLQAITQNFVSGLILLVERPVKIGDWVKLNDVEGDVRRINVRSTEIRVGDHSTMIVPNSELITKVVQNITKGNSLGRTQMFLSVPLDADLDRAIDRLTAAMAEDPDVMDAPAPAVFVDRVETGLVVLNCFAHVRSPRIAYGVRSRVLLASIRTLRDAGIPVSLPAQKFTSAPAAPG